MEYVPHVVSMSTQSVTTEPLHVKIIGWSIIAVSLYAMLEVSAWTILKTNIFDNGRSTRLEQLSSSLNDEQKRIIYAALADGNASGLRVDDDLGWVKPMRTPGERSKNKKKDTIRIVTFGDSFTYGDEADIEETWPLILENMLAEIEVLNFGVSAYGLDQAYLRYLREGKEYEHDIVIIGFILEDADRHVDSFRPFKMGDTGIPFAKPRFILDNEELSLIPSPLKRIDYPQILEGDCTPIASDGIQDCPKMGMLLRLFSNLPSVQMLTSLTDGTIWMNVSTQEKSNKFNLTTKIFLEFYRHAESNGVVPVILLMPTRAELLDDTTLESIFAAYEDFFDIHGMRYINVSRDLRQASPLHSVWRTWGHYSDKGNTIVANAVRTYLETKGLLSGLDEPDLAAPDLNVTLSYRFIQWQITQKRNMELTCNQTHCVQASLFVPLLNGVPVQWPMGTVAVNTDGSNPLQEDANSIIDGSRRTKWLDYNFNQSSQATTTGQSAVIIDTGTGNSITFNGYRWATANDEPGRDPVSWNVYGSQNGISWSLLDTRTQEATTTSRNTYVGDYTLQF